MSLTNSSEHSAAGSEISTNQALSPYVRYGFLPESDNPTQSPNLRQVDAPIPDNATTVSPIYLLTDDEKRRVESIENPYRVTDAKCIATELQNCAEANDRVLYPVLIENDDFHEKPSDETLHVMKQFVATELQCNPTEAMFYYSGNRSIHCHIARFVRNERSMQWLKRAAEEYCDETGADFDTAIYSRKRQFRLPGISHDKTGLKKVQIQPGWTREEIISKSNSSTRDTPESTLEFLSDVFDNSKHVEESNATVRHKLSEFTRRFGGRCAILSNNKLKSTNIPVIEKQNPPSKVDEQKEWYQYNAHPFSPYANADDGARSVAVIEVKGPAFARKEVTTGNDTHPAHALIPSYFHGACGCMGEYMKNEVHAPLQLSKQDYEKWDFQIGDRVAVIGGRSRNSRLIEITSDDAYMAEGILSSETDKRQDLLTYLDTNGYEIGSSGGNGGSGSVESGFHTQGGESGVQNSEDSEAYQLQKRAEQGDVESDLTHDERFKIACRLLTNGWEPAWEWFKQQFGADFDPEITRTQLQSAIEAYPDDYDHVEEVT
jgi:hypothetical protein